MHGRSAGPSRERGTRPFTSGCARWLPAVLLLTLAPAPASARAEWADWVLDAGVTSRFESNVNRADAGSEEEWDVSFRPVAQVGRVLQLAEQTRLFLGLDLAGDVSARFSELHALDLGGQLALTHKLGLGDAPWLQLRASGGYREVRADQRTGPYLVLGAMLGKRFSPRLDARIGYRYTRRWGRDGPAVVAGLPDDPFDVEQHEIGVEGSFLLTPTLLLGAGFAYRRGDFTSNVRDDRFQVLATNDVEAVAEDTVFGGWVYRVDGDGFTPHVRLNQALGDRWSVDLAYRFHYADGGGLSYRNHVVTAGVLFRY